MWTPAAFATSLNVAFDFPYPNCTALVERFLQDVQCLTAFAFCCASKNIDLCKRLRILWAAEMKILADQ
jgi:hypothetical protein